MPIKISPADLQATLRVLTQHRNLLASAMVDRGTSLFEFGVAIDVENVRKGLEHVINGYRSDEVRGGG